MVPRLTSLISLLAWRDQWRFLELTKAHVASGKKMAEIMYSSHNNWVLKVSRLALVLLYFPLWLVHCAFKHFITIFNWVLKVFRIALVLVWFCFIFLCDWSKKLAPLSQTIRYKTTINLDLVCNIFLIFWAVWLFLRRVQTGF